VSALPRSAAYVFDLDGTLADTNALHGEGWIEALASHGVHIDLAYYLGKLAGLSSPNTVRHFFGPDANAALIETLSDRKHRHFEMAFAKQPRSVRGATALVQAARAAGIKIALATSATPQGAVHTLRAIGLHGAFDAMACTTEVLHGKPAPDVFLLAARKLNVAPADCIVFEDSPHGIAGAHAAGMRVVGLATALSVDELLSLPGVIHAMADFSHAAVGAGISPHV
jgi:beta-phosphoglucomutase